MKHNRSVISIKSKIEITYDMPVGVDISYEVEIPPLNKSQSAVYEIRNKYTDQIYIGQTRKLDVRWKRHIRDLIAGEHCSKLQEHWNMFRAQNTHDFNIHPTDLFSFAVIIYCRPTELSHYENALIKSINPFYNIKKENPKTGG